jgi:RNA polymerase sigma-70 factor (ECF subfamily)
VDNDSVLIRRIQSGEAEALRTLYQRYLPPLWRYVRSQTRGDLHATEDAVSETFLAALRGLGQLDPDGGSVFGWLVGIARHKVADRARQVQRAGPQLENETEAASEMPGPLARLERCERRAEVTAALDQLDADERLVLEWKYVDGWSVRRIAESLGRTEKAVESLLYRARESLRQRLAED